MKLSDLAGPESRRGGPSASEGQLERLRFILDHLPAELRPQTAYGELLDAFIRLHCKQASAALDERGKDMTETEATRLIGRLEKAAHDVLQVMVKRAREAPEDPLFREMCHIVRTAIYYYVPAARRDY